MIFKLKRKTFVEYPYVYLNAAVIAQVVHIIASYSAPLPVNYSHLGMEIRRQVLIDLYIVAENEIIKEMGGFFKHRGIRLC